MTTFDLPVLTRLHLLDLLSEAEGARHAQAARQAASGGPTEGWRAVAHRLADVVATIGSRPDPRPCRS